MNVSSRTEPLKIIQCSASPPKTMSDDCEDPYKLLNVSTESIPKAPSIWFSKRFVVAVLSFFGYMTYTFAQVISIAIVEMTTTKVEVIGNETITRPAEFNWNLQEVGLVLNMFWYGFFFSVIGGYLAQKFGGVTILGLSTMLTGIIVVLNPLSVRCNFYLFLLARGLIGLLQSFSSAGYTDVFARWVPRKERAAVMSIVLDGMYAGTAIMYPVCGFLAHKWGWSMTFYFTGTVCIGWSILWLLIVRNDPSQDHRISKKELEYILQGTENVAVKSDDSNPYKEILKSPSYWALSIGKFAFNWGSAFTVMYLPLYIKDMTHRNIKEIGLLAFAPNVSIFIIPAVGMSIDYWQNHSTLTTTRIHKTVISGAFIIAAISFAALTVANNLIVMTICFVFIKSSLSLNKIFLELITVNMAPNHCSLLSGLTLFWQTVGIIVIQTIIGFIIENHELAEWNTCFFLTTGVLLFSALVFVVFGSSEAQSWSKES